MNEMAILDQIIAHKKAEVAQKKARLPEFDLRGLPSVRDFTSALQGEGISIIAEIKRYSPSKKVMRQDVDPSQIGQEYEKNKAAAISVLTDQKFFGGKDEDIGAVRRAVRVPILRKEFIVDEYQIYESRFLGADAILLIASLLPEKQLSSFLTLAQELGLACLVEVHTSEDVEKALNIQTQIVGINNRNLSTLEVDMTASFRLRSLIPPGIIAVSESGIMTRGNVIRLQEAGFDAALIGETLMNAPDIAGKLRELLGK
jgi:indole-3-glycerol phosphate synthase